MQSTRNLNKGNKRLLALLLACLMLGLPGCGGHKKPKGILSDAEITNLMVEMYIAEAKINAKPLNKDTALKYFQPFEKSYLRKKKISKAVLKETYRYYLDRPADFEKIYDAVIDTLTLRERRVKQVFKKP